LREVIPGLRRLAILANVGFAQAALEMGEAQTAAGKLGLEVITSGMRRAEDIAPAFEAIKGRADALYVCGEALQVTHRLRINTLALGSRLPTVLSSATASQPETHVLSVSGCTIGASWQHPCDCDDQLMMERSDRVGNVALGPDWRRRGVGNYREWQVF
jgi:putative tryptophan/tyrosine transport system substrate-binding protein